MVEFLLLIDLNIEMRRKKVTWGWKEMKKAVWRKVQNFFLYIFFSVFSHNFFYLIHKLFKICIWAHFLIKYSRFNLWSKLFSCEIFKTGMQSKSFFLEVFKIGVWSKSFFHEVFKINANNKLFHDVQQLP